MPSDARTGLTTRLSDVDQLMAAHRTIGGLEAGRRYDVEGLNRAAIVMLCAHFEGYLEDVMAEALRAIESGLDPDVLTKNFHNPWPERIDDLFAFLGMSQPCRKISWQRAGNAAVRTNLEALVRMRNQVAHGATGVTVHRTHVTRYRGYVEGFVERFDTSCAIAFVLSLGRTRGRTRCLREAARLEQATQRLGDMRLPEAGEQKNPGCWDVTSPAGSA
jgi:RiboL-PSP-HEPN